MEDDAVRQLLASEQRLELPEPRWRDLLAQDDHQASPLTGEDVLGPDGTLDSASSVGLAIKARAHSIGFAIHNTIVRSESAIWTAVVEMERWIDRQEIVRVVGAGRALLAAAIPANRLAHAGARVFVLHDVVPLPNTVHGGNILAASASGKTASVLSIMATARRRNPDIRILGIADASASEFSELCDVFVGVDQTTNPVANPLNALADTGEYIISELLDAIVVAAAKRLGYTELQFRQGHEDLADTGPYLPEQLSP